MTTDVTKPLLTHLELAERLNPQLVTLPVSYSIHELDAQFIRDTLSKYRGFQNYRWKFDLPTRFVKRTGLCRIVVFGAYHPAIFALAQGIPAVCLARSEHYMNKFMGLAGQFGPGCEIVCLDDKNLSEKLAWAIEQGCETAEEVRPKFLNAAERQIIDGRAAYQQLYEVVQLKRREKTGVNEEQLA